MNAEPLLARVAQLLSKHRLDAVLIGNAAAALQGSTVTTVDLDFMFRNTARNRQKLRRLADDLDAMVMRPFYPASGLFRVVRDRDGLQLDFMTRIDGIRTFESLRSRSSVVRIKTHELRVASPRIAERITRSCKASARRRVKAITRSSAQASALKRESQRALVEQIRRLLALPMEKRTHFLRRRRTGGSVV